jgi:hypothetical protein
VGPRADLDNVAIPAVLSRPPLLFYYYYYYHIIYIQTKYIYIRSRRVVVGVIAVIEFYYFLNDSTFLNFLLFACIPLFYSIPFLVLSL